MAGLAQRTIKLAIKSKLDKLLATIKDNDLKEMMRRDTLVTGGSITSMLLGERVNDYDIYFKTKETAKAVAEYYVGIFNAEKEKRSTAAGTPADKVLYVPNVREEVRKNILGEDETRVLIFMKSAGVAGENQDPYQYFESLPEIATEEFSESLIPVTDDLEMVEALHEEVKTPKNDYRPIFMTDNAITLSDRVQIIIRFYGSSEEIHRNFDYIHCTGVYDYRTNTLHTSEEMLMAVLSKRLIYSGSLYPIASVLRMRKFIKRGWSISAGQVLKILHQLRSIDWDNPIVLNEQLMGVDVAYMHQLIAALQNRDKGQRVDQTYLANILDTIFDE